MPPFPRVCPLASWLPATSADQVPSGNLNSRHPASSGVLAPPAPEQFAPCDFGADDDWAVSSTELDL